MTDFALQFLPEIPQHNPDEYFLNPNTGQMTSRELLANAHKNRGRGGAVQSGAAQGFMFGSADEASGALHALAAPFRGQDAGDAYTFGREKARAVIDADAESYGGTQILSEIAGALSWPAGIFGGGMRGASLGKNAATGAATGAVAGGVYGFNDAEGGFEQRLEGGARGAAVGAAFGGALGAAVPAVARAAQGKADRSAATALTKTAQSTDDLKAASREIYSYLDSLGVVLEPGSYKAFAVDLTADLADEGLDEVLTPTAARGVKRIMSAIEEGDLTLKKIDTLRKVLNSTPQNASQSDKRLVSLATKKLDDYVAGLMDSDVVAGSVEGIGDDIARARELWGKAKKSERITEAIEAAQDAASGFENGLRVEFRKIIRNKNQWSRLSPDEQAAIREVVKGTPTGNLMKRLSRLGFGQGQQTSVLSGTLASGVGGAAGFAFGGPVGSAIGAVVPAGVGKLGSKASEALTLKSAERARAIAASGGVAPQGAIPAVSTPNVLRLLPQAAPIHNALAGQPR